MTVFSLFELAALGVCDSLNFLGVVNRLEIPNEVKDKVKTISASTHSSENPNKDVHLPLL
jgi:hypothetical protein